MGLVCLRAVQKIRKDFIYEQMDVPNFHDLVQFSPFKDFKRGVVFFKLLFILSFFSVLEKGINMSSILEAKKVREKRGFIRP